MKNKPRPEEPVFFCHVRTN